MPILEGLELPIVQAPLAGGASTPALAAAVCEAGGLGFLAAGYKTADAVRADLETLRGLTERPFGLNIFAPPGGPADDVAVRAYAARLCDEGELGEPRHDDDGWEDKLAVAEAERVPLVTFTFGCPEPAIFDRMHAAGAEAWVTVTSPAEARIARDAGADALVVQGVEAGGHRAVFDDDDTASELGVLAALQLVRAAGELPLVATGGPSARPPAAAALPARAPAPPPRPPLLRPPPARDRPRRRRRARGRRLCRRARHRVHAHAGGGHGARAPRGLGRRRADRAHARVQRPHGSRNRQPLPARALGRGAARLPGHPPRDRAAPGGRARAR